MIMETFSEFFVKNLKFYSDIDYFCEDNIRYRGVFYYPLSENITAELTIVNKYYGIKDWELNLSFEVDGISSYNEPPIIERNINRVIGKDEAEVKILHDIDIKEIILTENFCNEFTLSYRYNDLFNDTLVKMKDFIVYYSEEFTKDRNPFFDVYDFKLTSNSSNLPQKIFSRKTHSIYMDLNLNCLFEEQYMYEDCPDFMNCELFFVLRNEDGEKISECCEEFEMFWNDDDINIEANITTQVYDLPEIGKYTIEVLFSGYRVLKYEFRIDNYDEIIEDGESQPYKLIDSKIDRVSHEDTVYEDLYGFEGLDDIKEEIKKIEDYVEFKKGTEDFFKGKDPKLKLHFVFSGNPGTGKTKLALKLGKIFKKMGILSKGNVNVVGRNNLVGRYVGETAIKTAKAIEDSKGGILFVDEAYSLYKERSDNDFGTEAIEILIKEMSDGQGDLIIIAAGYPKEMETFLKSNPGLASRFKYHFKFPDFTTDELLNIAMKRADRKQFVISEDAENYLRNKITEIRNKGDEKFGNARFIINMVDKAEFNFSSRLMDENRAPLITSVPLIFDKEDFEGLFEENKEEKERMTEPDEYSFEKAMEELNKLTGIDNIKKEITELAKILKYYKEEDIDFSKNISLHSIFKGNPGTGKTTVARIIAKLYKSLGLLEKGHLVECDRSGLVAEYIGQTAIKTSQIIDKAMGGVLFVDEAYSLYKGDGRDFGNEAIEILLKRMEDSRGKFAVICAGYSEEMDNFLHSNPGLMSRFDKVYEFKDYSMEKLYDIALKQFKERGLDADGVSNKLMQIISRLCKGRNRYFGNAREIRNLTTRISLKHDLRLSKLPKIQRTDFMKSYLEAEDLDVDIKSSGDEKPPIGFRVYEN